MRTVKIEVRVKAPDDISNDDVATYVEQLIDVGVADAQESSRLLDMETPDADEVLRLEFQKPQVVGQISG
jgi:hypothetical protein